jgi:hypothetical protein
MTIPEIDSEALQPEPTPAISPIYSRGPRWQINDIAI